MNLGPPPAPAHRQREPMGALNRCVSFFWEAAPAEPEPVGVEKAAPASDVPQMPATPVTQPVGSSGIGVYAGYITDNEKSADLRGTERYRKFEEWKRLVPELGMAIGERIGRRIDPEGARLEREQAERGDDDSEDANDERTP